VVQDSETVVCVKIEKLQHAQVGQSFSDVGGQLLYVPLNKTREFKAIPDPNAPFPYGKPVWGGTSGASGIGSTVTVTFYNLSSSKYDGKTVTAECGNTQTATVMVFTAMLRRNNAWSANNDLPDSAFVRSIFNGNRPAIGGPQPAIQPDPANPGQDIPARLTAVEIQADIIPAGLEFLPDYADYFGIRQRYNWTRTYTTANGVTGIIDSGTHMEETGSDNFLDRDGEGGGDTFFFFDSPGDYEATFQDYFQAIPTARSITFRQDFTTYVTYKTGNIGEALHWTITATATRNPDGTITYSP